MAWLDLLNKVFAAIIALTLVACSSVNDAHPLGRGAATYFYSGEVSIDPASGVLSADLRIDVSDPSLDQVTFFLSASFTEVQVEGDVVQVATDEISPFGAPVARHALSLSPAGANGMPRQIRFSYGGVLLPTPLPNGINEISPSVVELTVDSQWHPIDARLSETIDADLTINLAGQWIGVADGQVTRVAPETWKLVQANGFDIPVTFLENARVSRTDDYAIFDRRSETTGSEDLQSIAAFCTSWLNDRFGKRDPLPQANIVVHDREAGGYARRTLIALA
ncbi:MAG: hypothetical protein HRU11_14390, partial [Parvularculaceae bacterium]|nr:hypothetical protein [Parvularculaceae bacterium]